MSETSPFPPETVLIVDDEESVRRTFREWLVSAGWDIDLCVAGDAETALRLAGQRTIDLAILDWNLGSGSDGLQLLEDLALFHPDITAILVTGFAHRATPLDALRMGVRDYLDKNQDLNRETFLRAVRKQLDRIRPARRARAITHSLREFRETVEKILPLVQAAAALNDPVPLPRALSCLFGFTIRATQAEDGVIIVRHPEAGDNYRAYQADGEIVTAELVPFQESLAAAALSLMEPLVIQPPENPQGYRLQPFERGRREILVTPVNLAPGGHLVLELFDRRDGSFNPDDRQLARMAVDLAGEFVRHSWSIREPSRMLFDAVEAALRTTQSLSESGSVGESRPEKPPPPEVLDRLREGLRLSPEALVDADAVLELAEAIRSLAVRHGPAVVRHCTQMIQSIGRLVDSVVNVP